MNLVERIAARERVFLIAEIGINHNGDMALARETIDAAAEHGADCVKFQNFVAERYISRFAGRAGYQNQAAAGEKSQREIIAECELSPDDTAMLQEYTTLAGLEFLSTPFETGSLDLLLRLGVKAIKVSSCNLTNYPFLRQVAASGRPVLLSTGMGDMLEVIRAVEIFQSAQSPLLLFQCTSNYPAQIRNANLRVLESYRALFGVPVGFSDHTPGNTAAIAAVALGARAIEKHFTLSRDLPGIDQQASIEPLELARLRADLDDCGAALGQKLKFLTDEEVDTKRALRRSLVAARDLEPGEVIAEKDIAIKRPGDGFTTDMIPFVAGRRTRGEIRQDELFTFENLD